MGLKSVIASAVSQAFNALGASDEDGVQQSIDYYQVTGVAAYDPDLGTSVPTEVLNTFDAVVYRIRTREIDGIKIDVDETRAIFQQSEVSFIPNKDDRVEINLVKYNVIDVEKDPADATWVLQLRGV
jgi:hypothetical protein